MATATGVALETGLFDAEFGDGTVAFRNIKELGRDRMLKSHFDHHLDDSVREGGAVPPIWVRSRGADTALLGLTFVQDSLVFLVRADSDIHRFTDLVGRRCSLPLPPKLPTDFMRANTKRGASCTGKTTITATAAFATSRQRSATPATTARSWPSGTAESINAKAQVAIARGGVNSVRTPLST